MEQPAVAIVAVALRRSAVCDQHGMSRQFDVVDFEFTRAIVPQNGMVIDQVLNGDQRSIQIQRMTLGHTQIAVRHVIA